MTQTDQRRIALGAARSYLREGGIDPQDAPFDAAWAALNDLWLCDPSLIAAAWMMGASENQQRLAAREWRAWQQGQRRFTA